MKKFGQRLSFNTMPFSRGLHLFSRARPEIAIVNNSGLFFTLACLREHRKEAHPDLHVVMPEFWLDSTHTDFDGLDWGQTPLGLPWYVRNEFYKLYNDHSKHEYIRWGQIKELRRFIVSELNSFGVSIYTGIPEITALDDLYKIRTNEKTFSINKQSNHFYNSFRVPRVDHGFAELDGDLYKRTHTDMYKLARDKSEEDSIIVLGTGRSVIWLARHFPNTPIASIGYVHPRKTLFADEVLPSNILYYDRRSFAENFDLKASNPAQGLALISAIGPVEQQRSFIGKFYCAIGLKHAPEITRMIPNEALTLYPSDIQSLGELGGWVSPEEQPLGGLAEATSRWAITTDNMSWAYECYCYHPNQTIEYIVLRFENEGIELNYEFFDRLSKLLLKERAVPDTGRIINLYKKAYSETYYDVTEAKLKEIELILLKLDQERLSRVERNINDVTVPFKL